MKYEAAIIGVSGYAANYLNLLKPLREEIRLRAAVVRNPGKAAETVAELRSEGVTIYPSTDALYAAEKRFDLMMIPTGIEYHESMTVEALERGCNVLVEKPASASAASVGRMMEAEKKTGGRLFASVGFQHVYDPNFRKIKEILLSGEIGPVRRACAVGLWPRDDAYYKRNDWAGRILSPRGIPVLDSPANNALAHYLNILLFLCGSRFEDSAYAEILSARLRRARPEIENFDTCDLSLRTDGGALLRILFSHASGETVNPVLLLECERGSIEWRMNGEWSVRTDSGRECARGTDVYPGPAMMRLIADKLSDRNVFTCPLKIALEHTRVIESLARNFPILPVPPEEAEYLDGIRRIRGIGVLAEKILEEHTAPAALTV